MSRVTYPSHLENSLFSEVDFEEESEPPTSPTDTPSSEHCNKRPRIERGFFMTQSTSPPTGFTSKSTLLSANLTKHSPLFSPERHIGGMPVANADTFRDCMLVDSKINEHGEKQEMWYKWASPYDGTKYDGFDQGATKELYDGSDTVIFSKLLDVVRKLPNNGFAIPEGAIIESTLEILTSGRWEHNEYGDETEAETWTHAMSNTRLMVHIPLMVMQPGVDMRFQEVAAKQSEHVYTLETGELVVGTSRYRKCTDASSLLLGTKVRLHCKEDGAHRGYTLCNKGCNTEVGVYLCYKHITHQLHTSYTQYKHITHQLHTSYTPATHK